MFKKSVTDIKEITFLSLHIFGVRIKYSLCNNIVSSVLESVPSETISIFCLKSINNRTFALIYN